MPSHAIDNPVTADYTLAGDETVAETLTVNPGVTVDVAGHKLTVHGIAGTGTVMSSVAGGVLDLCIADTCVLDSTTITGGANMQVWKTGAGFLQMLKVNAGFGTGGSVETPGPVAFVVKAGRVKKGNDVGNDSPNGANAMYCGAPYCIIRVEKGGQFDIAGRTAWEYNYEIAGDGPEDAPVKGALINTVQPKKSYWTWYQNRGCLFNITLLDDASIGGTVTWTPNFWNGSVDPWLDLNGHVLTFASGALYNGEKRIYRGSGKIVIDAVLRTRTTSPSVPGCDVLVNGQYQMEQGQRFSPVRSLVFSATGRYNATENDPNTTVVHEKYAPNLPANAESGTRAVHPPVQLGDADHLATTLDLSVFASAFDASSVTFQEGSAVTVNVGTREIAVGDKLLAWNAMPASSVGFSLAGDGWTGEERNMALLAKADGLYVKTTLSPSYATRNVAEGKWEYFLADGSAYPEEWTGGITGEIEVRFSSYAEYTAIKTLGVAPSRFLLTALELPEGNEFYDMGEGLDFAVEAGITIDVKGNRLRLAPYAVGGITAFTVTSSVAGGVFDIWVDEGKEVVNTAVTITGGANMQVWKTGAGFLQMLKVNAGFGTGGSVETPGPVAFVVKAGRVKKGNDVGNDSPNGANAMYCGAPYCIIRVEKGGQFDIAGRTAWEYNYEIAGDGPEDAPVKGALINTVQPKKSYWTWYQNRGCLFNITLLDDASIGGTVTWTPNFWNGSVDPWLDLNGHVLTFASGALYNGEKRIYRGSGKIVIDAVLRTRTTSPSVPGCDVLVNGQYQMEQGQRFSPVRSLVFSATGRYNATENDPNTTVVHEKYAPNLPANAESESLAVHPPVQLGDADHLATTLDLKLFSAPFDATGTLSFFAGSTVSVDVSGRADIHALSRSKDAVTGKRNGYLMTWDAATWTAVSQADTKVKFELCGEANARYRLIADASGLLIAPPAGCIVIVR